MAGETLVLSLKRRDHDNYGTDDAVDVVIIAVYVCVRQRMAKANVGICIRWIIDDADRLSCSEADYGCKNRRVDTIGLREWSNVSPAPAPARSIGKIERRMLCSGPAKLLL